MIRGKKKGHNPVGICGGGAPARNGGGSGSPVRTRPPGGHVGGSPQPTRKSPRRFLSPFPSSGLQDRTAQMELDSISIGTGINLFNY